MQIDGALKDDKVGGGGKECGNESGGQGGTNEHGASRSDVEYTPNATLKQFIKIFPDGGEVFGAIWEAPTTNETREGWQKIKFKMSPFGIK